MTDGEVHDAEPSAYDLSLPRKRVAAGVLFLDARGRVLLVDPVYKPLWEIPGGAVGRHHGHGGRDQASRRVPSSPSSPGPGSFSLLTSAA